MSEHRAQQIYFVTSASHANLTHDDHQAVAALSARGISVAPLVWTDPIERIAADSVLVLRSVWDYHLHAPAFLEWLAAVEAAGHRVLNDVNLVRWNVDKQYLLELRDLGIPGIPTCRVARNSSMQLADVTRELGHTEIVIKPTVSASAFETHRLNTLTSRESAVQLFDELRRRHDLLLQPYIPEIAVDGEWSLIFFGGAFSHSVRKSPAIGDFRVQTDFGGTVSIEHAPAHVRAAATKVMDMLPFEAPLYTRVDGVVVNDHFLLMEAECIDPVLFFAADTSAAERFVDALLTRAVVRGATSDTTARRELVRPAV